MPCNGGGNTYVSRKTVIPKTHPTIPDAQCDTGYVLPQKNQIAVRIKFLLACHPYNDTALTFTRIRYCKTPCRRRHRIILPFHNSTAKPSGKHHTRVVDRALYYAMPAVSEENNFVQDGYNNGSLNQARIDLTHAATKSNTIVSFTCAFTVDGTKKLPSFPTSI